MTFSGVPTVAGLLWMFGNVVGATVNPYIGRYVDQTGNYHLIFVLLGTLPLAALIVLLLADAANARRSGR